MMSDIDSRVSELEAENARLRDDLRVLQEKYAALDDSTTARIQSLTDELELLAEANQLLMENQATAKRMSSVAASTETPLSQIPDELLLPGDGLTTTQRAVLEDVHAAGNLLSIASPRTLPHLVATGGVDKQIVVSDWKKARKLCVYQASAPVLGLAFNPQYPQFFVACFMDAKHALLRLHELDGSWQIEEVAMFHDHTRPGAMRVQWSSSGDLFATGSSDKSINVYRCSALAATGSDIPQCEKVKSFYFNGIVEAIAFVPAVSEGAESEIRNELLAIAVRDDCYVHYVDCHTMEKERINMNQDGIEHVSYTIMDLRASPSGKYLLAATDKDRHFVFPIKGNAVLRSLYGHKAGPYSQPRVCWHPSEKYVVSNTEDSGRLYVWCLASERVIDTIDAHDKLVRDLSYDATDPDIGAPMMLTVSYDKRIKVWQSSAGKTS
ncbi:hypothetical protein ATCC90586_004827 [Pythium insidiosum]|nr:hypothetical protein ATCC90586_004827 [Pythium insidiosum]